MSNTLFPGRPNYTGPIKGHFAFVHHGVLFEHSHNIAERITYINAYKPLNERATRLEHLMYLDPAQIDFAAYGEALKACEEAWTACDKAQTARGEAWRAYYEALTAYDEALTAYKKAWGGAPQSVDGARQSGDGLRQSAYSHSSVGIEVR